VVYLPTPLKNDGVKVSWDDEIPNIWKNTKCSKPPTRNYNRRWVYGNGLLSVIFVSWKLIFQSLSARVVMLFYWRVMGKKTMKTE